SLSLFPVFLIPILSLFVVFINHYAAHRVLHSFPTRRSSDLIGMILDTTPLLPWRPAILSPSVILRFWAMETRTIMFTSAGSSSRSEEHTSELQSRENLVCRLLLEKKNKKLPQ